MSMGGMSSSAMRRWISRTAPWRTASGANSFQSIIEKAKARTGANTGGASLEEEKNPLVTQRQSIFSMKEVEDMEQEEMEEESGVDIFRKRRGSIFGNNSGTIFGN